MNKCNCLALLTTIFIIFNMPAVSVEFPDILMFSEDIPEENIETYLESYINNPLDWNICDIADIEALPLNDDLSDRLINLKRKHKKINSWAEFQSLASLNKQEINTLRLFINIRQESAARETQLLNYVSINNTANPDLHRTQFRGKMALNQYISIGFITERDGGEPHVWDYMNTFATITSPGRFTIGLSSYKIDWGHGLVLARNNLSFKSNSVAGNVIAGSPKCNGYNGSDENRFFRGGYVTWQKNRWLLLAAVSHLRLDATIKESIALSFRETGNHCTKSELAAKDNLPETFVCSGATFTNKRFSGGVMLFNYIYPYPVIKYHQKNFRNGLSFFQKYSLENWRFSGEIAVLNNHDFAMVQGTVYQISDYSFGIQYRYLSDYYTTRMNSVIKEYSGTDGNEHGLYVGLQCKINPRNQIGGYVDFYSENRSFTPGCEPDRGTETSFFMNHRWNSGQYINFRLKRELSSENIEKFQYSISMMKKLHKDFSLSFRGAVNQTGHYTGTGFLVALSASINPSITITIGTTHFYSPEYETRVYLYEPGIPLRFNIVSLYGTGNRKFMVVQNQFKQGITMAFSIKAQNSRTLTEMSMKKTFLAEFQMVVDL